MEILQLDKPDTGYDRSLDSKHVPLQGKEELLAHSSSGNLHERCFHDIFLRCADEDSKEYDRKYDTYRVRNCSTEV